MKRKELSFVISIAIVILICIMGVMIDESKTEKNFPKREELTEINLYAEGDTLTINF